MRPDIDSNIANTTLNGTLHIYVAFDWGEEIDPERSPPARPAVELHSLPRKPRTPSSIAYRPQPLRFELAPIALTRPAGDRHGNGYTVEATVFDFAAVNVSMHIPFQLAGPALTRLAGSLSNPDLFITAARSAVEPLFRALLPTIHNPLWSELSEEYFVFQIAPPDSSDLEADAPARTSPGLAGRAGPSGTGSAGAGRSRRGG